MLFSVYALSLELLYRRWYIDKVSILFIPPLELVSSDRELNTVSRGARDSKIEKKWPESSRILDYILS